MAKTRSSGLSSKSQATPMLSNLAQATNAYMSQNKEGIRLGQQQLAELGGMVSEMYQNSEVYSFVTEQAIRAMADGGTLKSVIEIGDYDAEYESDRKGMARSMFGADTAKLTASDYEKYGVLGSRDADKFLSSGTQATMYGDVCIKFRKSSINNRVTYTFGDSYNMSSHGDRFMAGRLGKNPSVAGIPLGDMPRTYKKMKAMAESGRPLDATDVTKATVGRYGYIETQIHGRITASDIGEVYFRGQGGRLPKKYDGLAQSLREMGVKVSVRKW